jgi:bifunctional ADP-heptose synthase (sugar kinase/adenylyltransferase)
MNTNAFRFRLFVRGVIALAAALPASITFANGVATTGANDGVVVAQAGTTTVTRVVIEPFPAYQTGVRAAAAQGPEALRRYLWRTRMIYNFYYDDFAPRA